MLGLQLYGLVLAAVTRISTARDERGQATAEYALILACAAIVGGLVIAWAAKTGLFGKLFDITLNRVIDTVGG